MAEIDVGQKRVNNILSGWTMPEGKLALLVKCKDGLPRIIVLAGRFTEVIQHGGAKCSS